MRTDNRLPTAALDLISTIDSVVLGFDRISCWIDNPMPALPVSAIEKNCTHLVFKENRAHKFQPLWQSYVELFQPNAKACHMLAAAIAHGQYRTRPHYAELALDVIVANRRAATAARNFILAHLLVPHARDPVVCAHHKTFYFNRRAKAGGGKTPHVVALYSDKRSKLAGAPARRYCSHLEHRLSGSDALASVGIACMADFASFSHRDFWRQHLHLARLPAKAELGRFLKPGKRDCSGTALRKRADKFLTPFYLEDTFVLQNVRLEHPEIDNVLISMENSFFLEGISA
jgi:hypothetical protein